MENKPFESETDILEISESKIKYMQISFAKTSMKMYDYNCDIKVVVGSKSFKAHKEVLMNSSDYFQAMFSHDMQEMKTDIINLKEISEVGFSSMIEYFYHGYITIDKNNIPDVLEASRFFHVEWLISVCKHYLIHFLSIINYDYSVELAGAYCLDEGGFEDELLSYFCENFFDLSQKPLFLHLSFDLLLRMLSEDLYLQASEKVIFNFILKWSSFHPSRGELREQLLSKVKYAFLTPEEMGEVLDKGMYSPQLMQTMKDCEKFIKFPHKRCLFTGPQFRPRGLRKFLALFSGVNNEIFLSYKCLGVPGFITEQLNTDPIMTDLEFSQVTVLNNHVFFLGGYDRNTFCSSRLAYSYDPSFQKWVEISGMNEARVSFSVVSFHSEVFVLAGIDHVVVNGMDKEIILSSAECYDPEEDAWSFLPPLPCGCYNISSSVDSKGSIFFSGGIYDDPSMDVPVDKVYMLPRNGERWVELAPLLVARRCHASCVIGERMFVFGGFVQNDVDINPVDCLQNEVFDIQTDQWTLLLCDFLDIHLFHFCCIDEEEGVFLVGGQDESEKSLFRYDTKNTKFDLIDSCQSYTHKMVWFETCMPPSIITQLEITNLP